MQPSKKIRNLHFVQGCRIQPEKKYDFIFFTGSIKYDLQKKYDFAFFDPKMQKKSKKTKKRNQQYEKYEMQKNIQCIFFKKIRQEKKQLCTFVFFQKCSKEKPYHLSFLLFILSMSGAKRLGFPGIFFSTRLWAVLHAFRMRRQQNQSA